MKEDKLYQVIRAPHISEKGTRLADSSNQFIFEVLPSATKPQIKRAVELAFKVEVEAVQVLNVRGKAKRSGKFPGQRKSWKKAYVRLKQGHDIDFVEG